MLKKKFEMKIKDVLGEDLFGFRRQLGNKDASGMLRKYQNEVCTEKGIVWGLHWLAEGIWTCELDKNNTDPEGKLYRLARKKTDKQIVRGSEC